MDTNFYAGFEKRASLGSKIRSLFTKTKAQPKSGVKMPDLAEAAKARRKPAESFPRGSVIRPPKKPVGKKGPQTLDYTKINADITSKAQARKRYLREGGKTLKYDRMGTPVQA